jgi:hypothetical protein
MPVVRPVQMAPGPTGRTPLREAEWVVYAKRPFAGPAQVLDYVGRYTHRVAISNNRLLDIAEDKVTFRYKDYRHDAQQKTMNSRGRRVHPPLPFTCASGGLGSVLVSALGTGWPGSRSSGCAWTCRRRNHRPSKELRIIVSVMKNSSALRLASSLKRESQVPGRNV